MEDRERDLRDRRVTILAKVLKVTFKLRPKCWKETSCAKIWELHEQQPWMVSRWVFSRAEEKAMLLVYKEEEEEEKR